MQREGTLDAGPAGTVVLLARANDTAATTNPLTAGNIGANGDIATLTLLPVKVRAGTIAATTNGTNLNNTGVIDVIDTIGGMFTATSTGTPPHHVHHFRDRDRGPDRRRADEHRWQAADSYGG